MIDRVDRPCTPSEEVFLSSLYTTNHRSQNGSSVNEMTLSAPIDQATAGILAVGRTR